MEAIRSGKIAAAAIDAWLRGEPLDPPWASPCVAPRSSPCRSAPSDRTYLPRAVMPERSVEEVLGKGNYVQIEEGLTDTWPSDEARRCLRCDVCIGCGLCMAACSEMGVEALRMADTTAGRLAYFDFTRAADLCIGCGACTQLCPTGAIHFEDRDGMRQHHHHRHDRVRTAAADLQRMRSANADASTPGLHPPTPARPHGGAP